MLSFSNNELNDKPTIGASITCPHCNQLHDIQYGQEEQPDGTYKESKALAFYVCNDTPYLAGIDGKNIMDTFK